MAKASAVTANCSVINNAPPRRRRSSSMAMALCVRDGRDGVACCCACTSLEDGLPPQARQRAEAAPSICRWCTYVGAAVRLELCSCLHATVLFIQCSFLVDSCQMATNLPRPARGELLVWTTSPTAGSL